METLAQLEAKQSTLYQGQKNFMTKKKEIAEMYSVLEETYNDSQITQMENALKMKK